MVVTLLVGYVAVALVAAVVVFVASARLGDERRPGPQRLGLSLAAGAVWPVLLLGLADTALSRCTPRCTSTTKTPTGCSSRSR